MANPRLTERQRDGLLLLAERTGDGRRWIGAREGIEGTTLCALSDRGYAKVLWSEKPYRRLVGKITEAGVERARGLRTPA